jgi:hypothetical protein
MLSLSTRLLLFGHSRREGRVFGSENEISLVLPPGNKTTNNKQDTVSEKKEEKDQHPEAQETGNFKSYLSWIVTLDAATAATVSHRKRVL